MDFERVYFSFGKWDVFEEVRVLFYFFFIVIIYIEVFDEVVGSIRNDMIMVRYFDCVFDWCCRKELVFVWFKMVLEFLFFVMF